MNKKQIDFIKHCGEHFEVLTGGRGHSKTKEIIEKLEQENQQLKDKINKAIEYIEKDYEFANYDIPLLTKDEQLAGKLLEILKEDK